MAQLWRSEINILGLLLRLEFRKARARWSWTKGKKNPSSRLSPRASSSWQGSRHWSASRLYGKAGLYQWSCSWSFRNHCICLAIMPGSSPFRNFSGGCPAAQHGLVVKMDPVGFVCGPALQDHCGLFLATCQSFLLIHVSKTRKLFKGCHQNFLHLRWETRLGRQAEWVSFTKTATA